VKNILVKIFRKLARLSNRIVNRLERTPSKLCKNGTPRSLYRTARGDLLWLNDTGYIDLQIINNGEFEPRSTAAVHRLVKQGYTVLDVGANIGYYSVMLSRLVGDAGKVYAFEPTQHFIEPLHRNLDENRIHNVEVLNFGLSNKACEVVIDIGPSSATIHSPAGFDKVLSHETIRLSTLVDFVDNHKIEQLDFIKIDVDGHEPMFFEGAWPVLDRISPVILCEVSHLHYFEAGYTAWDFYATVLEHGYRIYNEDTFEQIHTKEVFLRTCGNFDRSANIILSKAGIT
jgi:FkbM family methyltransferase